MKALESFIWGEALIIFPKNDISCYLLTFFFSSSSNDTPANLIIASDHLVALRG